MAEAAQSGSIFDFGALLKAARESGVVITDRHSPKRGRKYYHASPRRFRRGDFIRPGAGWDAVAVFMNDSPEPHRTISEDALSENWFVYEVEPVGSKPRRGYRWDEWQAPAGAEVVRVLGRARSFAPRHKQSSGRVKRRKSRENINLQEG